MRTRQVRVVDDEANQQPNQVVQTVGRVTRSIAAKNPDLAPEKRRMIRNQRMQSQKTQSIETLKNQMGEGQKKTHRMQIPKKRKKILRKGRNCPRPATKVD